MDPVSTLAFSCNILDLVERGHTCCRTFKELYKAANGLSKQRSAILEAIESMQSVIDDLCSTRLSLPRSRTEKDKVDRSLLLVASRCEDLASDLAAAIEHCRVKKPGSLLSTAKGAVRALLTQDDIAKIELALQQRGETLHMLLLTCTQNDMRMEEVHEAADETFGWILEVAADTSLGDSDEINFAKWLKNGLGVFHVTGKPGSGKSTLMKYIVDDPRTSGLLAHWAGVKKLVISKFFLWRLGSREQKSFRGLTKGLLYSAVRSAPELIEFLFPQYWDPPGVISKSARMRVEFDITERDVTTAFSRLVGGMPEIADRFQICFFIDGLDEFDEHQGVSFLQLRRNILQWTSALPESLKICVTSRQWPVFEGMASSESHKMSLHDLTQNDISKLVTNTLNNHENFQKLQTTDPIGCQMLINEVVNDAEGVFLWVTLILRSLEDGLSNNDPLSLLQSRVATTPQQLNEFFETIINSIDTEHRRSAYFLFAIIMRMAGSLISSPDRSPELRQFDLTLTDNWTPYNLPISYLSLLGASFLFWALDGNQPLDATAWPEKKKSDGELTEKLKVAAVQVRGRCKGLVVVDKMHTVKFIHRTIPEYLQQYLGTRAQDHGISDGMLGQMLLWTLLAEVKFLGTHQLYSGPASFGYALSRLRQVDLFDQRKTFEILDALDREAIHAQWAVDHPPDYLWGTVKEPFFQETLRLGCEAKHFPCRMSFSVVGIAAFLGLHEYLAWRLEHMGDRFEPTSLFASYLLTNIMGGLLWSPSSVRLLCLKHLFDRGVSANLPMCFEWYQNHNTDLGSVWHSYLFDLFCKHRGFHYRRVGDPDSSIQSWVLVFDEENWKTVEICLEEGGANPEFAVFMKTRGFPEEWQDDDYFVTLGCCAEVMPVSHRRELSMIRDLIQGRTEQGQREEVVTLTSRLINQHQASYLMDDSKELTNILIELMLNTQKPSFAGDIIIPWWTYLSHRLSAASRQQQENQDTRLRSATSTRLLPGVMRSFLVTRAVIEELLISQSTKIAFSAIRNARFELLPHAYVVI
ncbi:hypothetical protein QBC37DRAFT_403470 [Rhypophila decipiens]|uniref:Nephrocystin 3-like N-terminal domain-containing protein n=1 Tax=Rhypophila decipiens TaxID=261697 RepID=A0AAN7B6Z4_9PEZI|nr:hypothetical protein QBC37DRAFT_403470 [Rhypophila decipiens]